MSEIQRLLLATVVLAMPDIVPRMRRRRVLWQHVALLSAAVLLGVVVLVPLIGSPLWPDMTRGDPPPAFLLWRRLVEALWWLTTARLGGALLRLYVAIENRPREERILADLASGAILIAAGLAVVSLAFDVPLRGLLATSGVIAIVLGLALQSTLSDMFSGIAVGVERPYKAGDVINIDGGLEGTVLQVTWRSTHIATNTTDIAVVPNSVIAKARLINRSAPIPARWQTLQVDLSAASPVGRTQVVLEAALAGSDAARLSPAPTISCTSLRGDGITFEIGFSAPSGAEFASTRTKVLDLIQLHLRHAGIALAIPEAAVPAADPPTPEQLLATSDIGPFLSPEQRSAIMTGLPPVTLSAGETFMREGEIADAIHLIASGTFEVSTRSDGPRRVIGRYGPGRAVGAISVIGQTPSGATATTVTPVQSYVLQRERLRAAFRGRPVTDEQRAAVLAQLEAHLTRDPVHQDHVPSQKRQATRERLQRLWAALTD